MTVQAVIELLLELTHDTSASSNLTGSHSTALESAHEAAACSLRKALSGRFAASLGNLVEYESCQLPLPLGPSFRLNTLLGDCSLILKAEEVAPLKSVPLARRAPRDELEATRAAIQVFLLIRHARNVLLRLPDDVRLKTRTLPADAPIDVPASAQLLPCRLHLPGRPAQGCRLLLYRRRRRRLQWM